MIGATKPTECFTALILSPLVDCFFSGPPYLNPSQMTPIIEFPIALCYCNWGAGPNADQERLHEGAVSPKSRLRLHISGHGFQHCEYTFPSPAQTIN